jgi:beta-lactamase regulating signal transducer with metallopeptidase domain
MNLLLETAIKISLVVALGLLAASLLHRRPAALRHWMLAAAMAAALAMPLLTGLAPSWSFPVSDPVDTKTRALEPRAPVRTDERIGITTAIDAGPTTASPEWAPDPASILLTIWIAGLSINLGGLLVGFLRLRRIAAHAVVIDQGPWADATRTLSEHFGLRTPVRLLQSDQPAVLVTWGLFTPKVMLPVDAASWDADRIHVVLAHELAHVQRRDWIVQIGGELLRIIYWFNPLVWFASSRLRLESERACDDAVVNLGVSGRDYALHLLDLARQFGRARHIPFPAVAIVPRPSSLERRVTAMLNARLSRRPVSGLARFTTLAALLAVALPIALFAQNTFATISGSLMDESGALLPGVTVRAIDKQRSAKQEVRSDSAGRYELIGLPQGDYTLEALLPGFETARHTLTLNGQDVVRNMTLALGTLQETILVSNTPTEPREPRDRPAPARPVDKRPACEPAGRGGPAPPHVPANGVLRIGGQIRQPAKTKHVSPVYPPGSGAGIVRMDVVIGPDGLVKEVTVTSATTPALALSAENAVRQWEFTQTLLNCAPMPVRMSVFVEFR